MSVVDDALAKLKAKEASLRCSELTAVLEGLGMTVEPGASGKHRTVQHDDIPERAGNFDGGHGRDSEVKSSYVRDMRKLILKYYEQLTGLLEK